MDERTTVAQQQKIRQSCNCFNLKVHQLIIPQGVFSLFGAFEMRQFIVNISKLKLGGEVNRRD